MKQRVAVLGSTGSIGVNTLDVIARHPGRFEAFALTASTQVDLMARQCATFRPAFAVMADADAAKALKSRLAAEAIATEVLAGPAALEEIAAHPSVTTVMAAIVGAAGMASCMAAAQAGKRLLLANKEALVVGGELFMEAVAQGGAKLLPIDSEHSAIFQSLPEDPATWNERVDKIILTASGGPFRTRDPASLRDVTPQEACAHPNWVMGRKISVDSATMMNKGLEVIEAHHLFRLPPSRLQVVIHPQSVIHSMVQYRDHSVVAQLGTPDMRVPIAYGLSWPDRVESGAQALDFHAMADMSFEAMDSRGHPQRFPGLALAWEALEGPRGTTAVLNAANEVAVAAFLAGGIRFDQIHDVNRATLDTVEPSYPQAVEELLALDRRAREAASATVRHLAA
jgi:1-deoxy-D-xylulose-5-phosphate reductoisomerase